MDVNEYLVQVVGKGHCWGRIVLSDADVVVVMLEERSSGYLGTYISFVGGNFHIDRVNC